MFRDRPVPARRLEFELHAQPRNVAPQTREALAHRCTGASLYLMPRSPGLQLATAAVNRGLRLREQFEPGRTILNNPPGLAPAIWPCPPSTAPQDQQLRPALPMCRPMARLMPVISPFADDQRLST